MLARKGSETGGARRSGGWWQHQPPFSLSDLSDDSEI